VHGRPRATKDIDVLVQPTRVNAERLARALAAFGYDGLAVEAGAHFARPERMATLGVPPVRIDILSSIKGVRFETAWAGRRSVRLPLRGAGAVCLVPFLGARELRRAKVAAGRPQDLVDVALLDELTPPRRRSGK